MGEMVFPDKVLIAFYFKIVRWKRNAILDNRKNQGVFHLFNIWSFVFMEQESDVWQSDL